MTHLNALTRQDNAPAKAASDSKFVWTDTVVGTLYGALELYDYSTSLFKGEE